MLIRNNKRLRLSIIKQKQLAPTKWFEVLKIEVLLATGTYCESRTVKPRRKMYMTISIQQQKAIRCQWDGKVCLSSVMFLFNRALSLLADETVTNAEANDSLLNYSIPKYPRNAAKRSQNELTTSGLRLRCNQTLLSARISSRRTSPILVTPMAHREETWSDKINKQIYTKPEGIDRRQCDFDTLERACITVHSGKLRLQRMHRVFYGTTPWRFPLKRAARAAAYRHRDWQQFSLWTLSRRTSKSYNIRPLSTVW